MDMDRYIGRLLDNRYEILEVIGTGGMAVVYKARCHRLNRLVAVKILKDDYSQDDEFRRRFHAESHAVAMLSHPNIVSVYDVSTSDDADYIVMELIDGITLKQYMERKGVLNWKETLHFAIQIAKALEHAHGRGIIHRDIKPHNVMVLKNGSVKVTDFGIARVVSKSNTLTKEALGSVHYISPEQAKGGRVDNCSDLYSLGVVMYEMMTGRPPYDGETPVSVAIQHINGKAPMPSTLNPNIPGGLEQIIMKAMATDPAERYASAAAMLYDMDEFRKDPTILFDYHNPDVDMDAALHIKSASRNEAETMALPKTTAERVAGRSEAAKPRPEHPPVQKTVQKPRRQREEIVEEDAGRSGKVATIAIIACSVVAILAILILVITVFNGSDLTTVPNLVGLQETDLADYAQRYDLEFRVGERTNSDKYEKGQVMDQTPKANTQIAKGGTITVTVSLGKSSVDKIMPGDIVGKDEATAKSYLTGTLGISSGRIQVQTEVSSTMEAGLVIRTEPVANAVISEDQTVILYISSRPDGVLLPDVEGQPADNAIKILKAAGFDKVSIESVISNKASGTVVRQSVAGNQLVDVATHIVLQVSLGANTGEESVLPTIPEPDPELVYKVITIEIPENAEIEDGYVVSIWYNGEMLHEQTVVEGTRSVQFEVSGKGVMEFTVDFNGDTREEIVDFDA